MSTRRRHEHEPNTRGSTPTRDGRASARQDPTSTRGRARTPGAGQVGPLLSAAHSLSAGPEKGAGTRPQSQQQELSCGCRTDESQDESQDCRKNNSSHRLITLNSADASVEFLSPEQKGKPTRAIIARAPLVSTTRSARSRRFRRTHFRLSSNSLSFSRAGRAQRLGWHKRVGDRVHALPRGTTHLCDLSSVSGACRVSPETPA